MSEVYWTKYFLWYKPFEIYIHAWIMLIFQNNTVKRVSIFPVCVIFLQFLFISSGPKKSSM